ncbi:MAG TPA: PEP/pyruvate-binding domain-containing protein [Spirochaetota bacterium]|nr:PEP/pyruvate-binding domain-containing protein [Spirochaetota bacterium]HPI89424.1 PEP/pyruvate-binding domain-containing protein [Spirochaetota bacterium]HPR46908.1 PEP/pyruvate-binding domain-containing protein [Spirochaetota bacterium]
MKKTKSFDLNDLLLPLGDKVGANQKVSSLIVELQHPNIDWKYVVAGIRTYLYDYLYDIPPYCDRVFPIIFYYLKEATLRRKASALRASDTFIDRLTFVLNKIDPKQKEYKKLRANFISFAAEYMDLLIEDSREGFFFNTVNAKILTMARALTDDNAEFRTLLEKTAVFLEMQYVIYTHNAILSNKDDIAAIAKIYRDREQAPAILGLLNSVTSGAYEQKVEGIRKLASDNPAELIRQADNLIDFTHNVRVWEQVCVIVKKSIEDSVITDDGSVIYLLEYLIIRSNSGSDKNLQLFISRTVASVCSSLVRNRQIDLLKNVIDLVMPELEKEIIKGENYFSAFSTIFNIGKTVVESGNIFIIDYFIDHLVQSNFCFPEFSGIASDWSVIVNSSHLENIRTWMKLIELNPPLMKKLAAALIVNLKLGGVFLKDTDVFQRDISRLLNSDYGDVFYLITSLAAVFPAFYHDIGATGDIRAFTEKIDTNHEMNDIIHFLRKQVHVESSSRTVQLFQKVMEYWMTGNKNLILGMVPQEVYDNLDIFFKMVNFDVEEAPQKIYREELKNFPELGDRQFWDFLNEVDHEKFIANVAARNYEGVTPAQKQEAVELFNHYFQTKNPTEMTKILHYIKNKFGIDISKTMIWKFLYEISDDNFRQMFEDVGSGDISRVNIEKFITFLHVYRMLFDKYNFSEVRAIEKLELYTRENLFSPVENFFEKIKSPNTVEALDTLLAEQNRLKRETLLSKKVFEPVDTIEFKRHIAFGIPSMYGSYKEKKFDTLKVFFHMNLIRVRFFETLIEAHDILPGVAIDYGLIKDIILLFFRAFLIDGLSNQEMVIIAALLDTPNLKISQLKDIITHLLAIHGEVSDRFNETFKFVCKEAINNIGLDRISEKYLPQDQPGGIEIIVDRFMRDQIMQFPLLQLFDNFLIRLKEALNSEIYNRGDIVCLNGGQNMKRKKNNVFPLTVIPSPIEEGEPIAPVWEVGAKAHGLLFAKNIEGINVPSGFILSSELFKRIRDGNIKNPRFLRKMLYYMKKYIDEFTDRRFANSANPVLLSVRSGAVFSMPGVMDTITNVGITQEIVDYYAKQDAWFAYDCYRRLIQDFAISFYGMDRSIFENLMAKAKDEAGVPLKEKLSGKQMELLTRRYRYVINEYGFSIPKDPYEQLLYAVIGVYQSWYSKIARNYRDFVNISEEWGTAVIVQRMVFGNYSPDYITGVVHSVYLGTEYIGLFGEYKTRAQGHDIVSGVAKVFPISEEQKKIYVKFHDFPSMESQFPSAYRVLYDAVTRIREKWGNDVEIEFTIENDVLYILQIRGMTKHIFEIDELEESPDDLSRYFLGQGLAASGGAVSGRVVFDIDRIDYIKEKSKGDKIILVRPETNPEDVIGLKKSDGILTCIGGMTSHAVLQMRRLEKSGVSDFSIMKIEEESNQAIIRREDESAVIIIREGDFITIDGSTGNVYLGYRRTRKKNL